MIVSRIWLLNKQTIKRGVIIARERVPLLFVVRIVIESALLYTCVAIFAFSTVFINDNMVYIGSSVVSRGITHYYLSSTSADRYLWN